MSYTISAENILCEILVKNGESISFTHIRRFSEIAQTKLSDCYFDITAKSIYAVMDSYSDIFIFENEKIRFTPYYNEHQNEVRTIFERRLPRKVMNVFKDIELEGIQK